MKKSIFFSSILCFVCPMVFSQTEAQVLFTCDKTIPSYYVLSDKGNAFCRNDKVDDVTNKHINYFYICKVNGLLTL